MRKTWAVVWDGSESAVQRCDSNDTFCDDDSHATHYATFEEAKKAIITFHLDQIKSYKLAVRSWRRAKAGEWK